jgi:hypothetical protein
VNIFAVDEDPIIAARCLFNTHVIKMTLETAQILSTIKGGPYKPTHASHPCVLWAMDSTENYDWLVCHGLALAKEYTYRYGKHHKSEDIIWRLRAPPGFVEEAPMTPFALAMPREFIVDDPVESYRNYYRHKAETLFGYKRREPPSWL